MKKSVLIFIIMFFLLCPSADAEIGSFGLIVEGGKEELVLQKGERDWLFVQSGFSGLPCFKGLTFFSDNTVVATVGLHTGIVSANHYGSANISVTDEAGENGMIKIKVTTNHKKPPLYLFLILLIAPLSITIILIKKR